VKGRQAFFYYYLLLSFAALFGIAALKSGAGETNLPPLLGTVRLGINLLYLNLAAAFFLQIKNLDEGQLKRRFPWIMLAAVAALLCSLPPVFSGDLMEYLIRGRMLGLYHASPYQHVPREFPNDILYPYSTWLDNPDSYGPLWVYLETLPALLFPASIAGMIFSQKLILLGAAAAGIYFFAKTVDFFGWPAKLVALLAYNPLYWVTAFVDGRNDAMMMSLSMISFYFLARKRFSAGFIFWTLAFSVKYMVLLSLPFFIIYAVREEGKRLGGFPFFFIFKQLALNLALVTALYWPLWGGADTFLALTRASAWFYTNTIPYAFHQAFLRAGLELPVPLFKYGFLAAYGFFYAWALWVSAKEREFDALRFVRRVGLVYLLFYPTIVIPFGFNYLLWALPWLVLSRWPYEDILVVLYSFAGLFSYFKRINFLLLAAATLYFGLLWVKSRRPSKSLNGRQGL